MKRRLETNEKIWMVEQSSNSKSEREIVRTWPFPSPPPARRSVHNVLTKFKNNGSVSNLKPPGKPRTPLSLLNADIIVETFNQNPNLSTRRGAAEFIIFLFFGKGISVWAAISSKGIIGPYFFHNPSPTGIYPHFDPCTVNSQNYLDMIQNFFLPHLKNLPNPEDYYFQQDRAPPHYATIVRNFLTQTFDDRWIGRGCPPGNVAWPPRSPDLTPPDFFLWGYISNMAYSKSPATPFDLQTAICDAFSNISVDMCRKVCRSVPGRLKTCLDLGGAQVVKNLY
jgi:hypothetical protein